MLDCCQVFSFENWSAVHPHVCLQSENQVQWFITSFPIQSVALIWGSYNIYIVHWHTYHSSYITRLWYIRYRRYRYIHTVHINCIYIYMIIYVYIVILFTLYIYIHIYMFIKTYKQYLLLPPFFVTLRFFRSCATGAWPCWPSPESPPWECWRRCHGCWDGKP